ncbi:c-type cytochrome [Mucilaginibacter corticis]|uniref:C-type cytochrome n=1 Tax=Mucilaginibacter corticis TaxID=2597670 RepID=A0A556MI99_9SPHI|nr:c-type cytochrome [Mucilaginibacter corticis]TSJ39634.1 c-type cytochrome [Mucilaginibacter corticis]
MASKILLTIAILLGSIAARSQGIIGKTSSAEKQILYGKDLIARTAYYFGPNGKVGHLTNGMNCQNCHNNAGAKIYGLNLSATATAYPQYMARTNNIMSIADRINGCMQRSLNGKKLDTTSKEMKAMIAYLKWLGKTTVKAPGTSGILKLAYLDHAADPLKGKAVFIQKCQACHGVTGQGLLAPDKMVYTFPPLWGDDSYNDGAGLYRLTTFAAFVKSNMPFGTTYKAPQLTDEEAWDVAAFVNSQSRPHFDQHDDWKDITKKPIDFPFAPYADPFSEQQHKYGPYQPIADAQKSTTKKN